MNTKDDMHSADIIAILHKRKTSLAELSRQSGLRPTTLANVFIRPWPRGEFLIAAAIGIHPSAIWPSRYYDEYGNYIDRYKLIRKKNGLVDNQV